MLFAKKGNAYKMKKQKLEKTGPEKEVMMKAKKQSVLDLERSMNSLENEKNVLMKTNENPVSCSFQTTTRASGITDTLIKIICFYAWNLILMLRK